MPMIVDPSAPQVTPPARIVSPDGWLAATVDAAWAGVVLAVDYTAAVPLGRAAEVLRVRILRTDPDGVQRPVRSADPAWAIEGVGRAYDHEPPLGAAVVYTATPVYRDGTVGPASAVAVTVPAPSGDTADVWIKSVDLPGQSVRVTVTTWPTLTWAARTEAAAVAGSPYPVAALDVYGSATSDIALDADGAAIGTLRGLLRAGAVLLLQTRPEYHRPDAYVVLGDVAEQVDSTPDGSRTFTASVTEVDRPPTAGAPLRLPAWSYDALAASYSSYDAVAASYGSYAALATNGVG